MTPQQPPNYYPFSVPLIMENSPAVIDGGYWHPSLAAYLRKDASARVMAEKRYAYSMSNPKSDHNPKHLYER
jgi:hypothetical protein